MASDRRLVDSNSANDNLMMLPMSSEHQAFLVIISELFGWVYTLAWSLSFYPQPILNCRRRSTVGITIDFPAINLLGFLSYLLSTSLLLYSPLIRAQYAARNPHSPEPTVRGNDVAFAAHAVILTAVTLSMFCGGVWGFEQRKRQKISRAMLGVGTGCVAGVVWVIAMVLAKGEAGGRNPSKWTWIDVVYGLGYTKLVITVVKYIPQAWTNYKRKSTDGWSIGQILLDVTGGVLSILQLVIDSSLQNDWSGLTGNPVKFGLGNVSIFFDIIFMAQHYWLYRQIREVKEDDAGDGEVQALLAGNDNRENIDR